MKRILLVSSRPGAGVTTIAVNMAAGLARSGYRVLISSFQPNPTGATWLQGSGDDSNGLLNRYPSLKWSELLKCPERKINPDEAGDYWLYICGTDIERAMQWKGKELQVLCAFDAVKDSPEEIIAIESKLHQLFGGIIGIDLAVPNKVQPGEWKKSSDLVLDLGNRLGWEKVADPIPYCEAIHDLAQRAEECLGTA